MSPGPGPRIAVMGGSLGGLTAGVLLRRAGFEVDVFERSRHPLEGRGAGIVLHPATVRAISGDTGRLSARAVRMRYLDDAARITHDDPCSYRFSSYAAVHQALLADFDEARYHLGSAVTGFETAGEKVRVERADGERGEYDLLIAADGIGSTARRALAPEVTPSYAGYVGWRGTVVEGDLTPATYEIVADAISYCILPNSHILIYPIPGAGGSTEPGDRLINWVWYRNCPEGPELETLLTDRRGERQQVAVGSGSVAEPVVEQLRAEAAEVLPGPLAEMVARSPEPFVQVVLDVAVERMAYERVAITGDAAFALRPHVAAGTAKAAEDAYRLTEALFAAGGDVPAALAAWEPGQLDLGRTALARTREAGVRSQFENSWKAGDPLPFGLYEDGDSAMR
jgi:2,6-dihydroxypyridine 3-monooxygenase